MRRFASAFTLTVVSAITLALSFPPWRLRPLAWIALVPFLAGLRRATSAQAMFLSWFWATFYSYLIGDWFPHAVSNYYEQPQIVGIAFFVGVTSLMGAPYIMLFAALFRRIERLSSCFTSLLIGAAWVTAELARTRLFTGTPFFIGNPWGALGYSQTGVLEVMQVAALGGIYAVSFVLATASAGIYQAWRLRGSRRRALSVASIAALPAIFAVSYGAVMLRIPFGDDSARKRVAVVQGNLDLGSQWKSEFYGRNLDVYLRMTAEVIRSWHPAIVFWPEAVMTFFLEEEPLYQKAIQRVLANHPVELVAGAPRLAGREPQPTYLNSIYVITPTGELRARYDKEYLVPFAEYFPFPRLDFLRRRFERVRVFAAGTQTAPLPTAAGLAGVATCNEAMLPEVVGARVAAEAEYLFNPSNDSWINDEKYSALQFDIVSARAIEQRRYLVRASTSGPSAVIDPHGRVLVQSRTVAADVITASIKPVRTRSIYGRAGDLFAIVCVIAVAGAALSGGRRTGLTSGPAGVRQRGGTPGCGSS